MVPDKILLPLPHYSERERSDYVFPDFLGPAGLGEGTIEVVRVDRDWGPGTKLLGALSAIREPCCLIVADDDVRYKPRFLEGIVNAQMRDQSSSFSYYTYIAEGLTVGQGCDGFSFWTPNIGDAAAFAEKHVLGTPLFFHDDFWISFYLASKGIPVKSLSHLLDDGPIYETEYVERTALRYLEGPLERGRLHREGFERLLREVEMPAHRRLKIRARAALHRFLAEPSRKIIRKLVNAF